MPPTQRRNATGVIERLLDTPQQFQFFQAVRLLDRWLDEGSEARSGLQRIQFRNSISLSFPASEVESLVVQWRDATTCSDAASVSMPVAQIDRVTLTPAFMGLLGVSGTLPVFYTEAIAQRELYQKDMGARAFMDLFSDRAVRLFYEAWKKYQLGFQFESKRSNGFLPLTLALAGASDLVGSRPARRTRSHAEAIPPEALAYYAGALQHRTWSVSQVRAILRDYFRVPVEIEQFVGRWYDLPEAGRSYLGVQHPLHKGLGLLGATAMLGERVWQRDLCMRVVLGPIPEERVRQFLPGSRGARALQQWLTLFFGAAQTLEVNLKLLGDHVKGLELNSGRDPLSHRLGWDTFLLTQATQVDRVDVRYDLQAAA
ncbi:MAG TPA: type VI secretion system baseplate subunit TssG [Aquabacterium sp.]|nr:type VI secretion system baseplate subunit TssG [Aquabacterium sp.]